MDELFRNQKCQLYYLEGDVDASTYNSLLDLQRLMLVSPLPREFCFLVSA